MVAASVEPVSSATMTARPVFCVVVVAAPQLAMPPDCTMQL